MQAIALFKGPDHVSAHFRIQAFAPALARAGWSLMLQPIPSGTLAKLRLFSGLRRFDVVLLQRQLLSVPELRYPRAMARRLVYDFDDAMLYRDSYDPRGHHSRQRAGRFAAIVGSAISRIPRSSTAIDREGPPLMDALPKQCGEIDSHLRPIQPQRQGYLSKL
jgi:hypothetical protein